MKKLWLLVIWLVLLTMTACAGGSDTSTPTIVPLERTPTATAQAHLPPTATRLPYPSPTPTPTPLLLLSLQDSAAANSVSSTPAATSDLPQAEVVAASLNIRQGPGVDYPSAGIAYAGDRFDVVSVDSSGAWVEVIAANGQGGWLSAKPAYTRIIGSLNGRPVAQATPPAVSISPISSKPAGGQPGKLVFMNGSGGALYVINADGSGLRRLADGVIDPAVSPNGQQVAFTRWDGAEMGTVYVINLDGQGERVILKDTLQAKSPTWSPDGQEIIVSFQHGGLRDPQPECREFDYDDGIHLPENIRIIKTHFSKKDGILTICFIRMEDLRWGLRWVNLATGQVEDVPADLYSYNPAWDPQKSWRVVYDGDKGLMQLDITNKSQSALTTDLRDTGPVFSPDGQSLALTYKQHDHWEVYTLDLTGSSRRRLTEPPILATPQYSSASPAWSPDGRQIAFVTDRTGRWEIWVMNGDGANPRPLFAPAIQAQLGLEYRGMNERMLNWVK